MLQSTSATWISAVPPSKQTSSTAMNRTWVITTSVLIVVLGLAVMLIGKPSNSRPTGKWIITANKNAFNDWVTADGELLFKMPLFDSFTKTKHCCLVTREPKDSSTIVHKKLVKNYVERFQELAVEIEEHQKLYELSVTKESWKLDDSTTTTKSASTRSSTSTSMMMRSGSEFNSQNISDFSSKESTPFGILSHKSNNLRVFTFSELKSATKNFSRSLVIGEGGFGCVCKGAVKTADDPHTKLTVAVKQLGKRGLQGHKEWVTEVNVLGVVELPNLVKLVGYCADDDERGIQRLLVYEYMPCRSVEDHLSAKSSTPLSWSTRLKIASKKGETWMKMFEGLCEKVVAGSDYVVDTHCCLVTGEYDQLRNKVGADEDAKGTEAHHFSIVL